ncbi:hypothetical protein LZ32DRAFT_417448 [Colletotrichum eremochloae]|nr:hypothetical protein LZ32DRAFT_417448 [Colletotrichum eremochloae]
MTSTRSETRNGDSISIITATMRGMLRIFIYTMGTTMTAKDWTGIVDLLISRVVCAVNGLLLEETVCVGNGFTPSESTWNPTSKDIRNPPQAHLPTCFFRQPSSLSSRRPQHRFLLTVWDIYLLEIRQQPVNQLLPPFLRSATTLTLQFILLLPPPPLTVRWNVPTLCTAPDVRSNSWTSPNSAYTSSRTTPVNALVTPA